MLRDRKIAVFIDVENTTLDNDNYARLMGQIGTMGEIVCANVYGASERKHKAVIEDAREHGYSILLSAKGHRRARKSFDNRIFVDVATLVARNMAIDTVAILSAPTDLVYLFSYLRRLGLQIIAGNDLDEQSSALAAERLDMGKVLKPKAPKPAPVRKAPAKAEPKPAPKAEEDKTAELLRQIEKLRADYESSARRDEPSPAPKAEPQPDITEETRNLMDKIASMQDSQAPAEEPNGPRAVYLSQNDSDLIRKIEELRRNNEGNDADELIGEIKKLLDELE